MSYPHCPHGFSHLFPLYFSIFFVLYLYSAYLTPCPFPHLDYIILFTKPSEPFLCAPSIFPCKSIAKLPCAVFSGTAMKSKRMGRDGPYAHKLTKPSEPFLCAPSIFPCKSIAKLPCAVFSGTAMKSKRMGRDGPYAHKLHAPQASARFRGTRLAHEVSHPPKDPHFSQGATQGPGTALFGRGPRPHGLCPTYQIQMLPNSS